MAEILPTEEEESVWRFGYGSNIALTTLQEKKNLNPIRHLVGTINGWQLYFSPGIPFVEPGFAAVRPVVQKKSDDDNDDENDDDANNDDGKMHELHGSAFLIPKTEADGLDRQEKGYHVLPSKFVAYDGEVIEGVGLYVPRRYFKDGDITSSTPEEEVVNQVKTGIPSRRYLRLLQQGAREAELSNAWIQKLDSFEHYVTPDDVRGQTLQWVEEFHNDPDRKDVIWTMEQLSKYDGSNPEQFPPHVAVMQYVVKLSPNGWFFASWKGHCITRRNLLHYGGKSVDRNDVRWDEEGFRPLPKVCECSDEEREYLLQNLETVLHRGGIIVARLKECIEDGGEMECL